MADGRHRLVEGAERLNDVAVDISRGQHIGIHEEKPLARLKVVPRAPDGVPDIGGFVLADILNGHPLDRAAGEMVDDILSKFKGKLISISRSDVIDNKALLDNIDNISHAYIDTLGNEYRKEILDTGKVTYTKHTAWEHNFSYENNTTYFEDLEQQIKDCLNGLISKPILNRSERVMF